MKYVAIIDGEVDTLRIVDAPTKQEALRAYSDYWATKDNWHDMGFGERFIDQYMRDFYFIEGELQVSEQTFSARFVQNVLKFFGDNLQWANDYLMYDADNSFELPDDMKKFMAWEDKYFTEGAVLILVDDIEISK